MIGIIVSIASMLEKFVGHYNNRERQWALRTMTTPNTVDKYKFDDDIWTHKRFHDGAAVG
jgi:hypothetical protein